ncbi:MAG: PrsW family glutamic-type intramembrane protease, partial [Nitrospira sp.]
MILSIIFGHVWGVLQLVVLGSFTRTVRLQTIFVAITSGLYGCALAAVLLQIAWTRPVAWLTDTPLSELVSIASYTLDPCIEELVKILPLAFLLRIQNIRKQCSLTDCILIGAALGSGFGLAEDLFRFSTSPGGMVLSMPFGWVIQKGLSPVTIFGPWTLLTSWLPESVSVGDLLSFQTTPRRTNLHLAWSAIAGLAVGLLFLRSDSKARMTGIALLFYVTADHAVTNLEL